MTDFWLLLLNLGPTLASPEGLLKVISTPDVGLEFMTPRPSQEPQ